METVAALGGELGAELLEVEYSKLCQLAETPPLARYGN